MESLKTRKRSMSCVMEAGFLCGKTRRKARVSFIFFSPWPRDQERVWMCVVFGFHGGREESCWLEISLKNPRVCA